MVRNGWFIRLLAALTVAAAVPLHAQEPNNYAWIHIAQDRLDPGVTLPRQYQAALEKHLIVELQRALPRLLVTSREADPPLEAGQGMVLTWTITKFNAGNQEMRRQIGLGFGTTRIDATYRFVDSRTGKLVLEGRADGKVVGGWIDGGDSMGAARGLAKEIAGRAARLLARD